VNEQRARIRAVLSRAVAGDRTGAGGERDQRAFCRAHLGKPRRSNDATRAPRSCAAERTYERIVAATVEQKNAHFDALHHHRQLICELDGLPAELAFVVEFGVDGNEIVLAVDLKTMSGEEK